MSSSFYSPFDVDFIMSLISLHRMSPVRISLLRFIQHLPCKWSSLILSGPAYLSSCLFTLLQTCVYTTTLRRQSTIILLPIVIVHIYVHFAYKNQILFLFVLVEYPFFLCDSLKIDLWNNSTSATHPLYQLRMYAYMDGLMKYAVQC